MSRPSHGYPRPQLRRNNWLSLNGAWDFALDREASWSEPEDVSWNATILVPFSPETRASGIGNTDLYKSCWYRRTLPTHPFDPGHHLLLHFGAVDYRATVWVNGRFAGTHEGGYTPFTIDITSHVRGSADTVVVVRAEDDPGDLTKPRGKQDWQREPHSIWYPRTTGIWQSVWLERVPVARIDSIRWTTNLERWEIGLTAWLAGDLSERMRMSVELRARGHVLARDSYAVIGGELHRRISLSDPGIDDSRNELLWNPSSPTLIEARLRLRSGTGTVIDEVRSYTALRTVGVDGDRMVLNGRPYFLRLVLDQGYWPETGLTSPDDRALRRDVQLAKAMGFNGVRKHQKIEDPRYLYWADRLGLLVWAEMPSTYRFTTGAIPRVTREWMAALARDYSHPSVITWVPFNESWGVPNLPANPAERHFVRALYHLTKTLDPTRPVVGNDGWESVATDIVGIHDYDLDPARMARRYHAEDIVPRLFKRERQGGRLLVLEGDDHAQSPIVLTEFGGIALSDDPHTTWGYSRAATAEELETRYTTLLAVVNELGLLSGFCYTQFADTFQETNGLLYADRRPKFPLDRIAKATSGAPLPPGTTKEGSPRL
ncbi:MAG: glycoside hydrolase family 2 protein, partial [Vicinamibacterales bacterium]